MRVFLDTNVLASGLAARGLCSDVVRSVLELHVLVVSERMLKELQRVLRTKFDVPADAITETLWMLSQDSVFADEHPGLDLRLKDRDDVPIVSAAHNANADCLVTGDAEVRRLAKVGSMRVLSPREFWEELRRTRS